MLARNNGGIVTIRDVMFTAVARERLGKHVSGATKSRDNRRAVFSVRSLPRGYKEDREDRLSQLSFEKSACQDMSLGAGKLN
jgi:hypothetical protein